MRLAALGGRFIAANRAICDRIEERLPRVFTRSLLYAHSLAIVAELSRRPVGSMVLDIGGGQQAPFIKLLAPENRPLLIGFDIAESQIAANKTIDFGIVGDACAGIPLRDATVDVAITRSLLEHLPDPRATINEIGRVLSPQGVCIHVLPSRYSPFSLLNRLIPSALGRRILFAFFPEWLHTSGFPAYYRNCDAAAIRQLHERAGLVVRSQEVRYYQSIYFKFFVPLYLISLLFDLVMYRLGWQLLACQVLMIAEKPDIAAGLGEGCCPPEAALTVEQAAAV